MTSFIFVGYVQGLFSFIIINEPHVGCKYIFSISIAIFWINYSRLLFMLQHK